ncbi:hypothetical protein JCM8202v2_000757 [Rhodotorula sphaerocarpa]
MPPKRPVDVLVLDSDDEDPAPARCRPAPSESHALSASGAASGEHQFEEDLALAMELSLKHQQQDDSKKQQTSPLDNETPAQASSSGGETRADLERARLERQRAREANAPEGGPIATPSTSATVRKTGPASRVATVADLPLDHDGDSSIPAQPAPSRPTPRTKTALRFWDGAVKRVPNIYVPDEESLSFGDLVGPRETLEKAVVSAYCMDASWVASHFPADSPLLLVMPRVPGDNLPKMVPVPVKDNTLRVIPPYGRDVPDPGVMHIKLMLYFHADFLRIIIPTANAVDFDWARIDNILYVHDFPLLAPAQVQDNPLNNPTGTQFSRRLIETCKDMEIPKGILADTRIYDFTRSADVRLVPSIQGTWPQARYDRGGGLAALARAVSELNFASGGRWELEATGSSIGRYYSSNWLGQMLGAANGIHPSTYFGTSKDSKVPAVIPKTDKLPIKILFPTESEILEVLGIHKYTSSPAPAHEGFIYLGSHNFTGAAWGQLQISKADGPQLVLKNWELGVVLPIRASSAEELEAKASDLVSYRRPVVRYGPNDRPWHQELFLKN